MVGRLIPAGTGLTYHKERKKVSGDDQQGPSAVEVEEALMDALSAQSDS